MQLKKESNNKMRQKMEWCSQDKCVHGAEFYIKITGKLLCKHCKNLLDKSQLTILENLRH
jgi:hypothetical protein